MQFEISVHDKNPIYKQLRQQIIIGIANGQLKDGEQLPSVRQLADELGTNAMTISKVYQQLKEEGYLDTDRRKGTTVKKPQSFQTKEEFSYQNSLQLLLAEAVLHGKEPNTILTEVKHCLKNFQTGADTL